ncbi:MAG: hypothetical protein RSG22_18325 [Comamonas sp.]
MKALDVEKLGQIVSSSVSIIDTLILIVGSNRLINENLRKWFDSLAHQLNQTLYSLGEKFTGVLREDLKVREFTQNVKRINDINERKSNRIKLEIDHLDERLKGIHDEFTAANIERSAALDEFFANEKIKSTSALNDMLSELDAKRLAIIEHEEKLNNLISLIASKALGGNFMGNALKEESAANQYRRYAILIMGGVGAFLLANFFLLELSLIDSQAWLARLAIAIFFSFFVGYLVRQAAVHRGQQFVYQQKAFDLNAVAPYVANLPDEIQHKIKQQMAEKLFVSSNTAASSDGGFPGVQELLVKLIDKMELPKTPR